MSKKLQVKVLNSTFFKEDTYLDGIFPSHETHEHLREILSEYYSLIRQSNVSERAANRISEILELAVYDRLLDECIDKIDQALSVQSEVKPNALSTDELLIQLRKLSAENKANSESVKSFTELVRQSQINYELVNSYIDFDPSGIHRQTILNQGRFILFAMCWLPGQVTKTHQHLEYCTETFVYRGQLTKTKFKRIVQKGFANEVIDNEQTYNEGEWLSINRDELHQLANRSSDNLVTLHYKYFNNDPSEREIISTNSNLGTHEYLNQEAQQQPSKLDRFLECTY